MKKSTLIWIMFLFQVFSCTEVKVRKNNLSDGTNMHTEYLSEIQGEQERVFFFIQNDVKIERLNNNEIIEQKISIVKNDVTFTFNKLNSKQYFRLKGLTGDDLINATKETKNEQVYFFEFNENNAEDLFKKYYDNDSETPISYMSFNIINDFLLVSIDNKDTLKPLYCNFENSSHITPFERLVITFPKIDEKLSYKIIYTDKLFRKGKINFYFPSIEEINKNFKETL